MFRRWWLLAVAVVVFFPLLSASAAEAQDDLPPSEPESFETGRFVVEFGPQAELAPAIPRPWEERGELVVDTLKRAAEAAQAQAIELVEATPGATFESHWITNALVVDGPADLFDRLRGLSGVSRVRPELARPILAPVQTQPATAEAIVDAPWGIEKVRAPDVWASGVLGGGVVVASLDSGVQFDHPALVDSYRGNLGSGVFDHNYNWFDASRTCPDTTVPCDDFGHGTHTMGTMVGGDGPGPFAPDVGMAPGAEWITVSCGPFFCTDGQLMEAGEWLLAPTDLNGENPDPSRRPDIINNSWGFGPGDLIFLDFVQAWRAAGMVPVFAAGNPGPFCGAGGSPGDYLEAFSVGATDVNDVIADFSGRGPSVFGKVNPNVSAPGVFVLSSVPGDNYEFFDGTSMAAPHVVGALALMMSADPALKGDVDSVTNALASTAFDIIDESCGGAAGGDPNNVYGDGRIDAADAVNVVATGGTLTGTVTDDATGDRIAGAMVTATAPAWESRTFTEADGTYRLFVPADTYVVVAEAFGFETDVASGVVVETDATTTQDLSLTPLPTRILRGVIRSAESRDPIAGALVEAIGVPVDPVVTDANGRYRLALPSGSYTIRASGGGCLIPEQADVDLTKNRRLSFRLVTKIDEFGHGCRPIDFDWVEAEIQSGVYGDDFAGRLDMPFSFPFYGETYERLFFATNGYVNFIDEFGFSNFANTAIPSSAPPDAAIYALWQDLIVDDQARIDYDIERADGQSVFVIEWENIAQLGTDNRLDMEVKLWEDGTIDLLYGDGVEELGNGAQATVGIENADATDALQFSFRESILEPNTAWRFEKLPTGVLTGTVTNANDGRPVAGATVTATPGDRSIQTDENGQYRIVLLPGRYDVEVAAPNYEPATARARIREGRETRRDFALAAAAASFAPTEVSRSVDLGETTDVTLTIRNSGTASLVWELKEGEESVIPAGAESSAAAATALPLGDETFRRNAEWARPDIGARPEAAEAAAVAAETLFAGPLDPVIDDPLDDALGPVDIGTILAGTDGVEASFRIDFSPGTPMNQLAGYLFLDTDQDPTTGLPAEALSGLPSQDVGMEYFVDLFSASFGEVPIFDAITFELIAVLPATISGQSLSFDVPLEAVGGDDGALNLASVLGTFDGPTDWAPDEGHGELQPFRDTDWMTPDPASGTTPAGGSTLVTLTLGGPDVQPGRYTGSLTLVSNDPQLPQIPVSVTLDVARPADFGTVVGRVTDERTSLPITAEVAITAERDGVPVVVSTTTDADGSYRVSAPEGTWPVSVTADQYVPFEGDVVVTAGSQTTLDVVLGPAGPQILISAEQFLDFELQPGASETRLLNIASVGTEDITFDIVEQAVPPGPPDVSWLTAEPMTGTVPPRTDTDVSVSVDSTGLEPGLYQAELLVNNNDPSLPSFPVPVNLIVLGAG